MKRFLEIIMDKAYFTQDIASAFIHAIGEDELTQSEIAAILTGIQFRGIALEELEGFRLALLDRALQPEIDGSETIDVCGTGGDGKDTFNISTTTAMVLAAMGYKVIKHGNYSVSSTCGSSNVLEMLGFEFSTDSSTLNASLKKINVCFLHAPLFHPTLKKVAPVRKQLGVRTLFNSLGPLVNPVQPDYQLTGTYALDLAKMYQHVLRPHRKGYSVLYGMDGYDEITLTDSTRMFSKTSETHLTAELIGRESVEPQNLRSGGSVESSAQILCNVLQGKGSNAQTDVVAANVSVAIQTIEGQSNAFDSYNEVQQFIRSGQAAKHFRL